MVKRSNILTKALPKELMSYAKSGDVSQSLKNIRDPLLNIYFNNDSQSRSDLLNAILKYDEENNLYTDKGRKFIEKATESGLLNQESIRDLYFKKYEDKYPYRN
jgi:Mg2+/Co2+ transporter CorC